MRNLESIFDGADRAAPNPFRENVYASGITPLPGVTEIHEEAMTRCIRAFESLLSERDSQGGAAWGGSGRTLLVAAPPEQSYTHGLNNFEQALYAGNIWHVLGMPMNIFAKCLKQFFSHFLEKMIIALF